jgi:predicted O-methyltransferase YrrM
LSARTLNLTDRLYDYVVRSSVREAPVLARLREETAKQPSATMQISPDQGQFMALLAELIGARHCLEIGTFTGYSTLAVALALPADGRIIACDIDEGTAAIARRF